MNYELVQYVFFLFRKIFYRTIRQQYFVELQIVEFSEFKCRYISTNTCSHLRVINHFPNLELSV